MNKPTRTVLHLVLLALIATLGSLLPRGQAQAPGPKQLREARTEFSTALEKRHASQRIRGVKVLVAKGWPQAFPWLGKALTKTLKSRAKLHKRYQELGRLINEKTTPFEHVRRPSPRSNIASMQRELKETSALLERDELVIQALQEGMGELFAGFSLETRAPLLEKYARRLRSTSKAPELVKLLETLGYLQGPGVVKIILPLAREKNPALRIAALKALGRQKDDSATATLAKALIDPFWQVQAVAVKALFSLATREAVTALISTLDRVEGRILQDIIETLKKLTKQNFRENQTLWHDWWTKNKNEYKAPLAKAPKPQEEITPPGQPGHPPVGRGGKPLAKDKAEPEERGGTSFYGIHTRSKRIIYILDISNSMNMPLGDRYTRPGTMVRPGAVGKRKIDQAIKELCASITSLPGDATFNIVFYNHKIDIWRKKQIPATPKNKKKAIDWAMTIVASSNTNIFDALEQAFKFAGRGSYDFHYPVAADTFFLLSDGHANRGRITSGAKMRKEVARLNKTQRVVIHNIALGMGADVKFMQGLANDTGGQFVQYGAQGRVPRKRR